MIRASYADSTWKSIQSQVRCYERFCNYFQLPLLPFTEDQACRYAVYLGHIMDAPGTISNYISGVKTLHKLEGFPPLPDFLSLPMVIKGIKRDMQHEVLRAKPIYPEHLLAMSKLIQSPQDEVYYTCFLVGFSIFLRKMNLVPDSTKEYSPQKQLSRGALRKHKGVYLAVLNWTKTKQFGEDRQVLPLVPNKNKAICPTYWLDRLTSGPGHPSDPLFAIRTAEGLIPITYRQAAERLRRWIIQMGLSPERYTLHGLRRGGASWARVKRVPPDLIQKMGDWASDAYKNYIETDLESRLKVAIILAGHTL